MKLIDTFVDNLFKVPSGSADNKKNQRMPLNLRIYELLTPSRLRLGSMDSKIEEMIKSKINLSIHKSEPITLIVGFGGFKNHRIENSPHINWAEVFHLSFLTSTLWEIAHIYKPGLKIEFSGDDIILPMLNNYKLEWTKTWNDEFSTLMKDIQELIPGNLVLLNRPASSFYVRAELESEVAENIKEINSKEAVTISESKIKQAINNFCFDGERNLSKLDDKEKHKLLERSTLVHSEWLNVDYKHRSKYLEGGTHIPVLHRKGIPGCYGIRSLKSSDIQFWEAYGVIAKRKNGSFYPTLLSASKFKKTKLQQIKVNSKFTKLAQFTHIPLISKS